MSKNLLTVSEVAKILCVSPLTLRNWDNAGKLRAMRHPLNNYRVYKRENVEALIKSMEEGTAPVYVPKRKNSKKVLAVKHI